MTKELTILHPAPEEQPMPLEKAREVLTFISNFPETKVLQIGENIGPFSISDIRNASTSYFLHLFTTHGIQDVSESKDEQRLRKILADGKIEMDLVLAYSYPPQNAKMTPLQIALELNVDDYPVVTNGFPLVDPKGHYQQVSNGFSDLTLGRDITALNLGENFDIDKYKFIVRGLRWMCANMLIWDEERIILPNQLDSSPRLLPHTPTGTPEG